jgi:hypothetical protein
VGVDVRGGAPGTRETDLLNPVNLVQQAHGVFLAGGSAFGLDTAAGIMQYLEEREIGFDVSVTRCPLCAGPCCLTWPWVIITSGLTKKWGMRRASMGKPAIQPKAMWVPAPGPAWENFRHGPGHEERPGKLCN